MHEHRNIFGPSVCVISRKVQAQGEGKKRCVVCTEKILSLRYAESVCRCCEKCIAKIHTGDFSCAVVSRVGRPGAVESHPGQTLTEDRPCYGMWETGNILKVSQSNVKKHLRELDYVNLFDVWVPRKSSWVVGVPSD